MTPSEIIKAAEVVRWLNDRIFEANELGFTAIKLPIEKVKQLRSLIALVPGEGTELSEKIYLNGHQIKQLVTMTDNEDECELVLCKFTEGKDLETGERMPAGLYAWYSEYPEEGSVFLPEIAAKEKP